jgi:hypothetical protein
MSRLFAIHDVLDSDAWYTPRWIFDGLGIQFDLDVAAPADAVSWIPADRHYSVADDGLTQPWHGTVWCNPPYSAPRLWCYRWAEHDSGCILLRADLSTAGPHCAIQAASSLYVPPKRLQFVKGRGGDTGSVNFSTILLGRGDIADQGISRLAAKYGGAGRQLRDVPAEER